ncbi:hypothetical protein GA0070606_6168 [Micromonospora citrea]|uniref:Lipoprotein n=1 Tax=Micromonospora citrea TaxID=47855 RepID=A0A1C6W1Z1_9ACTN|nr:hypothetical protein [Micromonospora citrea]SCL72551.1 hypothetical protein GA0070606_6168 [Micromonospora citrea]
MMLRPVSARTAAVLALTLALTTACGQDSADGPDRAAASASPTTSGSGEALEGQDKISDEWPREIPLPAKYKILSASAPDGNFHLATVFAVSLEDVRATLAKFESDGFKKVRGTETGVGGIFQFKNDKWQVDLIIGFCDANGEPTSKDTGMYGVNYNIGPVE